VTHMAKTTAITSRRMMALVPSVNHPIALPKMATPPQRVSHLVTTMVLLAVFLVGGLGTWAALAPMQGAVVASGQFGVLGDRLVIQHLEGGIVHEIAVREGERVSAGQVIARLDDTRPKASLAILENQLVSVLATQARLRAEAAGRDTMDVSPELQGLVARYPALQDTITAQKDLLTADRQLVLGKIRIIEDRMAQLTEQRAGARERLAAQNAQLALLRESLKTAGGLVEKGLSTRSGLLVMQRDEASLLGDIGVSDAAVQTAGRQIAEQQENKLQVTRDALSTTADALQQSGQTLSDLRQRIDAAIDVLERTTIRAPRSGQVIGLKINTLGEVVSPGESVAQIVPDNTSFVVEVLIKPDDINEVHTGGSARIRLTAYNFRTTPTVLGTVTRVSPDSLIDDKTGLPYYHALIELAPGALDRLPHVAVQPGMKAQVMIATRERTLADYLLGPVLSGLDLALREDK
jgi:HlyD family type I secretion membrane fusion protein